MKYAVQVRKNSVNALKETTKLITITKTILSPQTKPAIPDKYDWCYRLWNWADELCISHQDIPRNLNALIDLQSLKLSSTGIDKLPEEIFKLSNLIELSITADILKKIPNLFHMLYKLEYLDLSRNSFLECIPPSLALMKKIKTINIFSCALNSIPTDYTQSKQLKIIDISYNNLNKKDFKINYSTKLICNA
jgi:Leucine-rich repeat (LRR) protein